MKNKECSQCGAKFECGINDSTCWCVWDIEKKLSLFVEVKDTPIEGQDCYCKKCLEERIMQLYYNRQYGYSDHFFSQEEMDKMYPNTLTAITNRQAKRDT